MIVDALTLLRLKVNGSEPLYLLRQVNSGSIQLRFDLIEAGRVNLLAHLRALIVGLERILNFLALVDEIQNERVLFERVNPVQTRESLNSLNAGEPLIDVHGVQERLIEACLVLFRHQ